MWIFTDFKQPIKQSNCTLLFIELGDKSCLLVNLIRDTTDPDSADGKTPALNVRWGTTQQRSKCSRQFLNSGILSG